MAERNTDSVPAMLTPGEFVFTDTAVENAGGPGPMYGLMNILDPSSKKPREDGYQGGGPVTGILGSLLSRIQKKDEGPVYPKPEMLMPSEEMMEMIMPGGGAKATLQMGKGGIRAMLSANKEDILKNLAKMRKTGEGSKKIAEAVDWQTYLKKLMKESTSRRFTNPIKKQKGGSIDDYSLMDYMMPAMDKRLGPSLKKFQFGGGVPGTVPGTNPYVPPAAGTQPTGTGGLPTSPTGFGGGMTGTAQSTLGTALGIASAYTPPPSAQSLLAQPSGSLSTGIGSIFQEAGLQTPGADYLGTIAAYDPTEQQRQQQDYGRKLPGPVGGAGKFAKSGAAEREAGEQREMVTQQYQYGAEDLRKQYRENLLADIAQDIIDETYDFEDLA